jgi:hypothetical protein
MLTLAARTVKAQQLVVRLDDIHGCDSMQALCRASWRVQTPAQILLPGVLQSKRQRVA